LEVVGIRMRKKKQEVVEGKDKGETTGNDPIANTAEEEKEKDTERGRMIRGKEDQEASNAEKEPIAKTDEEASNAEKELIANIVEVAPEATEKEPIANIVEEAPESLQDGVVSPVGGREGKDMYVLTETEKEPIANIVGGREGKDTYDPIANTTEEEKDTVGGREGKDMYEYKVKWSYPFDSDEYDEWTR